MSKFLPRIAAVLAACMLAPPAGAADRKAEAAKALVEFLASPESATLFKAKGFEIGR